MPLLILLYISHTYIHYCIYDTVVIACMIVVVASPARVALHGGRHYVLL